MSGFYEYTQLCSSESLGMKWGVQRNESYLEHHGVKGQKWGVRRYQNYDGTLIKSGSKVRRKTKYTNIDGSLNERGKVHSQAYINKQMKRNNKYYEKHIRKYEKLAEKYKDDPEMRKKFQAMKEDAIRTRDSVNNSIKEMGIDEIMANEAQARDTVLKVASVVASGAILGAGAGLTVRGVGNAIAQTSGAIGQCLKNFDPKAPMDTVIDIVNTTDIGRKGEQAAEMALRTYGDARAYAMAILADQTIRRLDKQQIPQRLGTLTSGFVNSAVASVDQDSINALGGSTTNALVNLINTTGTTAISNINNVGNAAINNVGSIDYATSNAMGSMGNTAGTTAGQVNHIVNAMSNDQRVAALMNDPNLRDTMLRMIAAQENARR